MWRAVGFGREVGGAELAVAERVVGFGGEVGCSAGAGEGVCGAGVQGEGAGEEGGGSYGGNVHCDVYAYAYVYV